MVRLVDQARRKLGGTSRKMSDEEDVAIIAFENFCRVARKGKFLKLHDRDDLWQDFLMLIGRRAADQMRKRSNSSGEASGVEFRAMESADPTPEFIALWRETPEEAIKRKEIRQLIMQALEEVEEKYRLVFLLRDVEGFSTDETAKILDYRLGSPKRVYVSTQSESSDRNTHKFLGYSYPQAAEQLPGGLTRTYINKSFRVNADLVDHVVIQVTASGAYEIR